MWNAMPGSPSPEVGGGGCCALKLMAWHQHRGNGHTCYPGLQALQVAETEPTPELLPASPSPRGSLLATEWTANTPWAGVPWPSAASGAQGSLGGLLLLLLVPHLRPLVSPQGRLKT